MAQFILFRPSNLALAASVLFTVASVGCAVGLAEHPLTTDQLAALHSRATPTGPQSVPGMMSVFASVVVHQPPEVVWEQLAVRFGEVHQWSGPITDSQFSDGTVQGEAGAMRSCTLAENSPLGPGETFTETIVGWDPERRYYAAGVNDGFFPLRRVVQEYWVDETQTGSRVSTLFLFDLSPPMGKGRGVARKLKPSLVTSLLGLKHLLETGDSERAQDKAFLAERYPEVYSSNGTSPS